VQSAPAAAQKPVAHLFVDGLQVVEQHGVVSEHVLPSAMHGGGGGGASQVVPTHLPEQHSYAVRSVQAPPAPLHSPTGLTQMWSVSPQFCEQQSVSPPHGVPRTVQHAAVLHVPPEQDIGLQHLSAPWQVCPGPLHALTGPQMLPLHWP
jgi:hypothetical protein